MLLNFLPIELVFNIIKYLDLQSLQNLPKTDEHIVKEYYGSIKVVTLYSNVNYSIKNLNLIKPNTIILHSSSLQSKRWRRIFNILQCFNLENVKILKLYHPIIPKYVKLIIELFPNITNISLCCKNLHDSNLAILFTGCSLLKKIKLLEYDHIINENIINLNVSSFSLEGGVMDCSALNTFLEKNPSIQKLKLLYELSYFRFYETLQLFNNLMNLTSLHINLRFLKFLISYGELNMPSVTTFNINVDTNIDNSCNAKDCNVKSSTNTCHSHCIKKGCNTIYSNANCCDHISKLFKFPNIVHFTFYRNTFHHNFRCEHIILDPLKIQSFSFYSEDGPSNIDILYQCKNVICVSTNCILFLNLEKLFTHCKKLKMLYIDHIMTMEIIQNVIHYIKEKNVTLTLKFYVEEYMFLPQFRGLKIIQMPVVPMLRFHANYEDAPL